MDRSVSRLHAALVVSGADEISVTDLGSSNGTRLRGVALAPHRAEPVRLGETLEFGQVAAVVQYSPAQPQIPRGVTQPVRLAPPAATPVSPNHVVAAPAMIELYRLASRVAASPLSVLLLGETGVGKEALAEHLHACSPRAGRAPGVPLSRQPTAQLGPRGSQPQMSGGSGPPEALEQSTTLLLPDAAPPPSAAPRRYGGPWWLIVAGALAAALSWALVRGGEVPSAAPPEPRRAIVIAPSLLPNPSGAPPPPTLAAPPSPVAAGSSTAAAAPARPMAPRRGPRGHERRLSTPAPRRPAVDEDVLNTRLR